MKNVNAHSIDIVIFTLQILYFAVNAKYFLIRAHEIHTYTDSSLLLVNRLYKIVTIFKKLTLNFSIFYFKIAKSHSAVLTLPPYPRLLFTTVKQTLLRKNVACF